jgi:aspartate/methionine/tyrosine aminotransferase
MMSRILDSSRMQTVQSPIIPIVAELIRDHPGTISLGQGVVYYTPPPAAIANLAQAFVDPDQHRYQSVQGILPLRQAIQAKLQADNAIMADNLDRIVVTAGSNMGFCNAVLAISQPGDEIILLSPYYFNHEMAIAMIGCHPVVVATDANYQPQLPALEAAITNKTRAIVTISPNNPTGVVYSQETLQQINQLCQDRGLYHISDEAYEYFTYEGAEHFSPGTLGQDHTISLFSLSKAYGFASWRIGYMVIPEHLQMAIQKIQDTILICPPVVSQYAALGALQAGVEYCRQKLPAIAQIRQQMLQQLEAISDICTVPTASGAFYFLIKVNTTLDAMTLTESLIRKYGVAVIPGDTFGIKDGCYLRVAYGAIQSQLATEGITRLIQGLAELCPNPKHLP